MKIDEELDATGLLCPLPVLKAAKRLRSMDAGSTLRVLADDPVAVVDFPHFCSENGHELKDFGEISGVQYYVIQRS